VSPTAVIYRSDQASIGVTVAGITLDNLSWDVLEGGENTVEGLAVLPGGMAPQRALGGIPKRSPVTVKRLWSEALITQYKLLDSVAGQASVKISYTVLGTNRTPAFVPISYTGTLGTVSRPNYDAMKAEAAYLTIMVELEGELA
jgi:hypothetical protein